MNRSGSRSCTQPKRDGGNISIEQEPRRPGKPAPKALESGESTGRRRRPRVVPEHLHKWKSPFHPGGKQANTAKARPPKPRPGEPRKEKRTVSQFYAFRRVKDVTTGGTENGLKKEERHDRADSTYDRARTGTRAESQPPRK